DVALRQVANRLHQLQRPLARLELAGVDHHRAVFRDAELSSPFGRTALKRRRRSGEARDIDRMGTEKQPLRGNAKRLVIGAVGRSDDKKAARPRKHPPQELPFYPPTRSAPAIVEQVRVAAEQ